MKKILVTGANGQLGRKIQDNMNILPNCEFIFVDIEDLDITNKQNINSFFHGKEIDFIINCAAYTAVDNAEDDFENAHLVNTLAPVYLAEKAKEIKAKFIHISTDYVFDGTANLPYAEDDSTSPVSVYGRTKLEGEKALLEVLPNAIIIRTSWLYSEYGKNFAKTILKFAKEKESLKVVYDQIGTPTYAGSLANAILQIVKIYNESSVWKSDTYHYSNLGVCSWYDFAIKLLKHSNISTPIYPVLSEEFITKAQRPAYSVLNKSKIISVYNLTIPYWSDACDEMLENL